MSASRGNKGDDDSDASVKQVSRDDLDKFKIKKDENRNMASSQKSATRLDLEAKIKELSGTPPANPFIDPNQRRSAFEIFKMVVLWIFLIPVIRLVVLIFLIMVCASWCILLSFISPKKGLLRNALMVPVQYLPRLGLLVLGFYYITIVRLPGSSAPHPGYRNCFCCCGRRGCVNCARSSSEDGDEPKRAKVLACNHTTLLDVFVLMYSDLPAFLSKASVLQMPFIGTIAKTLGVIGVDRESAEAREKSKTDMQNHVNDPDSAPLLVFPEGTTTSSSTIMRFKNGAFIFEQPVQPILLLWNPESWFSSFSSYDLSNTATTKPLYWLFSLLSQFSHSVKIVYLPVYEPNEIEKADTNLFADRVRDEMLKEVNNHTKNKVWASNQAVDDFLIWKKILDINFFGNYQALASYSIYDTRQLLHVMTLAGAKGAEFNHIQYVANRYKVLLYWQELLNEEQNLGKDRVIVNHNKNHSASSHGLSDFERILHDNLMNEDKKRYKDIPVGYISAQALSRAFRTDFDSASLIFQVLEQISSHESMRRGYLDFRQILFSTIYLSPLTSLWNVEKSGNLENQDHLFDVIVMWLEHRWRIAYAVFGGGINRKLSLGQIANVLCTEHPSSGHHDAGMENDIPVGVGKPALLSENEVNSAWKELGFAKDDLLDCEQFVDAGIKLGLKRGFSLLLNGDNIPSMSSSITIPALKAYVLLDAAWAYIDRCFVASQAELINQHPRTIMFKGKIKKELFPIQGTWFLSDEIIGFAGMAHPPSLLQKDDRKRLSGIDDNPIGEDENGKHHVRAKASHKKEE